LTELAARIRTHFGDARHVHLVVENDRNEARYLRRDGAGRPALATAQWNDDLHHSLHVIATGESEGYYVDYAADPVASFGRALAEGFAFQGQASPYRNGSPRGEISAHLPPLAFVAFAQNHDQIGNRAFGERLASLAEPERLRALMACVLLAPQIPLLFMGEEFAASTPFRFFCDFGPDLADAVTRGRRAEFARFAGFGDALAQQSIPDPNALETFASSKLDWNQSTTSPGAQWRAFYRHCLALRRRHIVPWLPQFRSGGSFHVEKVSLLHVEWQTASGDQQLHLVANLSSEARADVELPHGAAIYATAEMPPPGTSGSVPRYAVAVIRDGSGGGQPATPHSDWRP
jgi:maltooligosyltrehalose trehalohydrolase